MLVGDDWDRSFLCADFGLGVFSTLLIKIRDLIFFPSLIFAALTAVDVSWRHLERPLIILFRLVILFHVLVRACRNFSAWSGFNCHRRVPEHGIILLNETELLMVFPSG